MYNAYSYFKTGTNSNFFLVEAQGTMPLVSCPTFLLKIDYCERNKHTKKDLLTLLCSDVLDSIPTHLAPSSNYY